MLAHDYSQLPVIRGRRETVGSLTDRDIVRFQAASGASWDEVMVGEALPPDAAQYLNAVRPDASVDLVRRMLLPVEVPAVMVTPDGKSTQKPMGIITRADLLQRV